MVDEAYEKFYGKLRRIIAQYDTTPKPIQDVRGAKADPKVKEHLEKGTPL